MKSKLTDLLDPSDSFLSDIVGIGVRAPVLSPNYDVAPSSVGGGLRYVSASDASGVVSGVITSTSASTDVATFAGSGIVFNNTYTVNVTQAYKNEILAAEQDIASRWTNSVTLNLKFDAVAQGTGGTFLATNSFGLIEGISYTTLKNALAAHATSADAQAALATLPATDPSGGVGWSLPVAYARMLGITQLVPTTDDTVTLNTSYNWSYGQDVIAVVEHELTEGAMGRIGGLGKNTDNGGNPIWSTMDLFRYSAPGVHDFSDGQDGKAAYFSVDGTQLLLQFNNQYSGSTRVNNGDTADFSVLDVFGFGSPGTGLALSSTDIKNIDVLGWTPATAATVIEAFGSTRLMLVGNQYDLLDSNGSGPVLKLAGNPVLTGSQGTWIPFAAEKTSTGYEVAWKLPGADQYTVWSTDSSGNFLHRTDVVSGTSATLESLEPSFQQDLNGDGVIGPATVIEAFGSTRLMLAGNQYDLLDSQGSGPALKLAGNLVLTGSQGTWIPFAAEKTATGYEVAWKLPGADLYTVWSTDSSGNFLSRTDVVSGASATLESLEPSFQQDLNGDGVIGLSSTTVIEAVGSTSLVQVGNSFYLDSVSSGFGPVLKLAGNPVLMGSQGTWIPFAVEKTSTGYEVAWKLPGADQYTVWSTDSSGNFLHRTDVVSGTSAVLESLEPSFQQDLNGDGVIGPATVIEAFGSTRLMLAGNQYDLLDSQGSGPALKLAGNLVLTGSQGTWTPIAAEKTATGYEVAWKLPGADQYTVWSTDSSGNFLSRTDVVSGASTTLESLEPSFQQDLNGDGVIGVPAAAASAGNLAFDLAHFASGQDPAGWHFDFAANSGHPMEPVGSNPGTPDAKLLNTFFNDAQAHQPQPAYGGHEVLDSHDNTTVAHLILPDAGHFIVH